MTHPAPNLPEPASRCRDLFLAFLRLGLSAFGGPVAHLAYFRDEFVRRRQWLDESRYADLVALCQFLPGPTSSQVGIALGFLRAGYRGALLAWLGFTLPSALLLTLCALGITRLGSTVPPGLLHGLKLVAVAVVAQAVWGMARQLCTDRPRVSIAVAAACAVLIWPNAWTQIGSMAAAGLAGLGFLQAAAPAPADHQGVAISRRFGVAMLACFGGLLIGLPWLVEAWPAPWVAEFNVFFRAGSLVFGGGHVMLPLLQASVVPQGWVSNDTFLAGYGISQAVPGPLSTFAAFLGASMATGPMAWVSAAVCLAAIFAPSFLLVFGALPFWEPLRRSRRMQASLAGVNAGVVGVLLAALYQPVWTSAIFRPVDFAQALLCYAALGFWRLPPWLVVLAGGLLGWVATTLA